MTKKIPKYILIKQSILNDIHTGKYLPGDIIPSDNELMRLFSVSKSTITQALKSLSDEGYIIRQQGRGSFVSDRKNNKVIRLMICPTEHNDESFWKSIVDSFNSTNKTFKVSLEFIYNNAVPLRDTLFKAFASGKAPDIFSLDGPDVPYWAYMNSIKPLDPYITQEFKNRFLPNIIKQGTYKGKLYHLGYNESTLCIIYNKELFKKLKIKVPENIDQAWNWQEFLYVCKLIKENTKYPYPLLMDSGRGLRPTQGEWISYSGLPFIYQNGGQVFDPTISFTNGYLNSTKCVEAMSWLGRLFNTYHYTHIEDVHELFPNNFAMSLSLPSAFFEVYNEDTKDKIGIMPMIRGIERATPHGGWGLCISNQTRYESECWTFLQYVFTLENQLKLYKITGMPVLNDIYNIYNDFNGNSSYINILFSQLLTTSISRPITPAYPYFSRVFTNVYMDIAKGADAQKALNEAVIQIDNHLQRHNYFAED